MHFYLIITKFIHTRIKGLPSKSFKNRSKNTKYTISIKSRSKSKKKVVADEKKAVVIVNKSSSNMAKN